MTTPRTRRSPTQWQQILNDLDQSGMSAAAYCREYGIAYQSLMNWRKRLSAAISVQSEPGFVELTTPGSSSALSADSAVVWLVELDLGDGLQLRIARR